MHGRKGRMCPEHWTGDRCNSMSLQWLVIFTGTAYTANIYTVSEAVMYQSIVARVGSYTPFPLPRARLPLLKCHTPHSTPHHYTPTSIILCYSASNQHCTDADTINTNSWKSCNPMLGGFAIQNSINTDFHWLKCFICQKGWIEFLKTSWYIPRRFLTNLTCQEFWNTFFEDSTLSTHLDGWDLYFYNRKL